MRIEKEQLASWIAHRRWFATKNLPIDRLEILSTTPIELDGKQANHVVVSIATQRGVDLYQLLIAAADREYIESNVQSESVISTSPRPIYELFGDAPTLLGLIDLFNNNRSFTSISFSSSQALPPATTARVIATEQSNSSVILGDHSIAKFYRRITPGINPDLEVGRALDLRESLYVPRVRGWVEGSINGTATTLMVLHEFFATAVDGFEHALASVRDLIANDLSPAEAGGDFAAEAERLGQAVRAVHLDLEAAFGQTRTSTNALIDVMQHRLASAAAEVPMLSGYSNEIAARYERNRNQEISVHRIHGDLHLGQVLRDPSGWKILDFEGEPGATLEERRAPGPAVRDVAGMLRSFDYASRQPLITHPEKERLLPKTSGWASRNREAFLRGYGSDLDEMTAIFELDKAVYEALYEHRFRPDWIEVPLGGIARLLEE